MAADRYKQGYKIVAGCKPIRTNYHWVNVLLSHHLKQQVIVHCTQNSLYYARSAAQSNVKSSRNTQQCTKLKQTTFIKTIPWLFLLLNTERRENAILSRLKIDLVNMGAARDSW